MACTICENCGNDYHWEQEWAFEKFGFNDGDGQVKTHNVADALRDCGYEVVAEERGVHNTVISSIKKDGKDLIPDDGQINTGYDNPRDYLPQKIISFLGKESSAG